MKAMRIVGSLLVIASGAVLSGCAASEPKPVPGADVKCLKQQVTDLHEPYWQALQTCHSPKTPDLTGDLYLQELANASRLPYEIRPKADALLKRETSQTETGTRIVGADPAF